MGCDRNPRRFYYCAQLKTPQSRLRLNFNGVKGHQTPNPNLTPSEHPIEVRADFGYRDFTLDGVFVSEEEDLDDFYRTGLGFQGLKMSNRYQEDISEQSANQPPRVREETFYERQPPRVRKISLSSLQTNPRGSGKRPFMRDCAVGVQLGGQILGSKL
ncbi:hypothetical protein QN277_028369 [Acacia crassicarpa]|uniref:Uncharacterized protein n=1 Tax=Acacia crassicarpa TaxID=499986 RepID=A0AAE1MF28_9FABA|nr:hypothetical protein QN277_028369 [Acacia crassicarpa]